MNGKRKIAVAALALVATGLAGAAVAHGVRGARGGRGALAASGVVEAAEVDCRAEEGGLVVRAPAREGDRVAAGDLLARLDGEKLDARVAAAAAAEAEAAARLALLRAGARPEELARAARSVALERERLREAERERDRLSPLDRDGVASRQSLDQAASAAAIAAERLAIAEREQEMMRAGPRAEEIRMAEAALERARAERKLFELRRADQEVRAPQAGRVTKRYVEPGERIPPGALVATVSDARRAWLSVYVTEVDLPRVRVGSPVEVTVDAYPARRFPGRVASIATEAQFTPKNLQTKEDRVKLVFEVRVDLENPDEALKPGMPADARIALDGAKEAPGAARPE